MQTTNTQATHKVPQSVLNTWNANLQPADLIAIAILYGHPVHEVQDAIKGHATHNLTRDISHYCGLTG